MPKKKPENKRKAVFVKSAAKPEGYPEDIRPEIAIIGRSNAGKSTLINQLCQAKMARVSNTPGKTDLLNFYNIGEFYRIVDTPGYGYAKRGGSIVNSWRPMIESYFSCRDNLVGAILVMDIRRDWSEQEEGLVNWLKSIEVPTYIVLTKGDKLGRSQTAKRRNVIVSESDIDGVYVTSMKETKSYKLLEDSFFKDWVR